MEAASGMALEDRSRLDPHDSAEAGSGYDGQATLILDRLGRILSCGEPAARILGTSPDRLMGGWISEFIEGLFLAGSSPSYRARHLDYLCADGEWQRFAAMDGAGQAFPVEANLARMASDRSECQIYLLSLRHQK